MDRVKRGAIFLGLVLAVGILAWRGIRGEVRTLSGEAMGTRWNLQWRGEGRKDLGREVAAVLEHWEQVMSQWREDSDLSRYNRGEAATKDLRRVLLIAEEVGAASGGAFEPRILARVRAAGFGPAGEGIDLSGIGKGFAVDRVGERLREIGVTDFVFELGGDLLAGDGEWRVEIEAPEIGGRRIGREVALRRRAMATSGNYRQFFPGADGLRSHIIDPRTGEPVERPASSVTVIAEDCATADGWATALFVLGPDWGGLPADVEAEWWGKVE